MQRGTRPTPRSGVFPSVSRLYKEPLSYVGTLEGVNKGIPVNAVLINYADRSNTCGGAAHLRKVAGTALPSFYDFFACHLPRGILQYIAVLVLLVGGNAESVNKSSLIRTSPCAVFGINVAGVVVRRGHASGFS